MDLDSPRSSLPLEPKLKITPSSGGNTCVFLSTTPQEGERAITDYCTTHCGVKGCVPNPLSSSTPSARFFLIQSRRRAQRRGEGPAKGRAHVSVLLEHRRRYHLHGVRGERRLRRTPNSLSTLSLICPGDCGRGHLKG